MTLESGSTLGHYEIVSSLGVGGMGEVYRARDESLGREIAVKLLPADLATDSDRLTRFEREAKVLASLSHPHIVTIFSVEGTGDTRFFTMELIEGRTLEAILEGGALSSDDFFAYALPICEAVAAAHRRGVTHRDLKPANVMVTSDGWVKVLDFGLAKTQLFGGPSSSTDAPTEGLTSQGVVLGTVPYMSPEQLQGKPLEPASDVYSLGAMLYEMAVGRRPFAGASQADLVSAILRDTPPPPSSVRHTLSAGTDRVLMRCLEKEFPRRYRSAEELLDALKDVRTASASGSGLSLDSDRLAPAAARTYKTPIIGRDEETRELRDILDSAAAGKGAIVTIAGEPGVGKTRLSWHLIEQAREQGFFTLVGNCYEGEGTPAYNPWVEILQTSARVATKETLWELLGDAGPEIAKLLPELRRRFPDMPQPLDLAAEEARRYLFRSFTEFLERSTRLQPIVLLLEDLQWSDEPSLLLLQHLAPHVAGMQLLIVGTYRDVELDVDRPLEASLREMVRNRLAHRIVLRRLPEEGVAAMLAALSGKEPPPSLVAAIHAETEGNPFFLEEVYLHLDEEGRLFDAAGEFRTDLSLDELDVPEGVRLVLGRRLDRLDGEGRKILTAAAVLGRRFSYSLLESVTAADPDVFLDQIESADSLRLIENEASASRRDPTYRFSHELVRQTLLQGLSLPRRQRLHLRIAMALEERDRPERFASMLAHHFYESGAAADEETTFDYLMLAGRQALEATASEEALSLFERARDVVDPNDQKRWGGLLSGEGRALLQLGKFDEAKQPWTDAIDVLAKAGETAAVAQLCLDLAWVHCWQGHMREGQDVSNRGLEALGTEPSVPRVQGLCDSTTWKLYGLWGQAEPAERQQIRDSFDELVVEVEEALDCLDEPDLAGNLSWARWMGAMTAMQVDAENEALTQESGEELWRSMLDPSALAGGLVNHITVSIWGGRWEDARAYTEKALATAEKFGNTFAAGRCRDFGSWPAWPTEGDLEGVWEAALTDEEIAQLANADWRATAIVTRGIWRIWRGEWEESVTDFRIAARSTPRETYWEGLEAAWEVVAHSFLGNEDEVLDLLEKHRSRLPVEDEVAPAGSLEMAFATVEASARLGRVDEAAALYPILEKAREQGVVARTTAYGLIETLLAISATCGGRHDCADAHFATALRQAEELPLLSERAVARHWQAWALMRRSGVGDRDRARMLVGASASLYEEMGLLRHATLARSLLS